MRALESSGRPRVTQSNQLGRIDGVTGDNGMDGAVEPKVFRYIFDPISPLMER